MEPKKFRVYKPLLLKIFVSVHLPLILLLAGFAFMTLRHEIDSEISLLNQQTEMILKSISSDYLPLFSQSPVPPKDNSKEYQQQAEFIQRTVKAEKIDILDPISQESLLSGKGYKDSTDPVFRASFNGLAESLSLKRQGKVYSLNTPQKKINRQKYLFGYIPFEHKSTRKTLVLTATFKTSYHDAIQKTATTLAMMFLLALVGGILISLRLAYRIVKPVRAINDACRQMLNGKLGLEVDIRTGDELEALGKNFNEMSRALMKMKSQAQDANPLTQLPGNQQIFSEMKKRLEAGLKFVYFHIDIDHFKAYNDRYGLGRGDDALRWTAELLRKTVSEFPADSFVGHQGGDDFVLITDLEFAEKIGKVFCKQFDLGMKNFYDEEVFKAGFFLGEDSRHHSMTENATMIRYPLMSVSMAGIANSRTHLATIEDILDSAVRVKKKAKQIAYSKALIEELSPI